MSTKDRSTEQASGQTGNAMRHSNGDIVIDEAARAASRKKLVWIFALFFLPLFLATIWFHVVRTGAISWSSNSRGELITPAVPFTEFSLSEADSDAVFGLNDVRGKWTILYVPESDVPGTPCDTNCEKTLYDIRQARLALNHRMERVQRVMLTSQQVAFSDEVQSANVGLRLVNDNETDTSFIDQINAAQNGMEPKTNLIYLIDPNGNLMMRYSPDQLPKPLFKDLKHLLKVSRIG